MKFLICKKQYGEGCDYTIGCGMRYDIIEANSLDDAIEAVVYPDGRDEYNTLEGDMALKEILIILADNIYHVDIKRILTQIRADKDEQLEQQQEAREIAEYKRLLAKYGKK